MHRPSLITGALVVTIAAAGCAAPPEQEPASADKPAAQAVRVESCGRTLSFGEIPERAVTLDQTSTEMLLALGVADRVAGTSNLKTKVGKEFQSAYADVLVLSPKVLTGEQLRKATPDLVVSSFTDLYTRDGVGTRDELGELGLPSYVSAVDCPQHSESGMTSFERLFDDYRNLGKIFGVEDRARELVQEQQATVRSAGEVGNGVEGRPTVVWLYSVINGLPYVAGKSGMPSEMSRLVGAKNAFDDVAEDWPEVSWEQIADRDPDFIVIGDLSERGARGDSAEEKLAMMRKDPAVSKLRAVTQDRIIVVPGIEMDPSVRSVNTLDLLSKGMTDLGYVR